LHSRRRIVWLTLPFLAFVLTMLFLFENSQMMRTKWYIREFLEEHVDVSPGWDSWLASRPELPLMDRHFSASFVVVFFVYYFLSIALALYRLWIEAVEDPSGAHWWDFFGAAGVYAVTAIWGFATLFCYWKSATRAAPHGAESRAASASRGHLLARGTG